MVSVGEGIKAYLNLFFAQEGGYINLTENDKPNYFLILELFYLIESFLPILDKGIEVLAQEKTRLVQFEFIQSES